MACEDRTAPIFVTTGYKLTKAEREDFGAEFDWQVDAKNAVEVILPNVQGQPRAPAGRTDFLG